MPQASDELRDLMGTYFGDRIDDGAPYAYLKSQGFSLTPTWEWVLPAGKTLETLPEKEFHCILFLHDEWDYGGVAKTSTPS